MSLNVLELVGFASLTYLAMSSLQAILYRYGYARGKEEALRDAKLAPKEATR